MTEHLYVANLADNEVDRIFFKDRDSRFLLVSRGWLRGSGGGRCLEDVLGKTDHDIFSAEHADAARADELEVMRTGEPMLAKLERETFDDRASVLVSTTKLPLRDDDGEIIGTYGISRDITQEVSREAAAHHARRDPVTNLLNRSAFTERVGAALDSLTKSDRVAVLIVNIDAFREINETLGRSLGDELLLEFGGRLLTAARRTDDVARLGADQFAVLCPALRERDEPGVIAERIRGTLDQPLLGRRHVRASVSIGIAWSGPREDQASTLIARAEAATFLAKTKGGGRSEVHRTKGRVRSRRSDASDELRKAITRSQLFLVYQPVIALQTGAIVGAEALVRWRHPERGIIAPGLFIPQAEREGLIAEIDDFVLRSACRGLAGWQRADPLWRQRTMAVNLSAASIEDAGLPGRVARSLQANDLAPGQLCLEITETAMIGEVDAARRTMDALAATGVHLALDDFGTGFSTLTHLQQLSADVLKIDRSFVARLGGAPRDREIVAAVCAMAHALGMTVVGEGVETPEQRQTLINLACDHAQGYLIARPLEEHQLLSMCAASANSAGEA